MELKKYRWSKVYESSEEELIRILEAKQVITERWVAEDGEEFPEHTHPHDKRLWCAEGLLMITVGERHISLQSGDTLDIPANTAHKARAGLGGCVCYEAPPTKENPSLPV